MNMEELMREIQGRVELAHSLLPSTIEGDSSRATIEAHFASRNWRQTFYFLKAWRQNHDCSEELVQQVEKLEELFELYDLLGLKRASEQLTNEERRIIGECLAAMAHGPFFLNDWEFSLVFGAEYEVAVKVAEDWPNLSEIDATAGIVINNTMNNLLGYPHDKAHEWAKYISVSPERVEEVLRRFRELSGRSQT